MRLFKTIVLTFCAFHNPLQAQKDAWNTLDDYISDSLIPQKKYDEAYALSIKNLQFADSVYGKTHINYSNSSYQLGQILYYKKEYKQAVDIITQSLEIQKTTPYKDSIYYGKNLSFIGLLYRRLSENDKAEQAYLAGYYALNPLKKDYPKEFNTCLSNLAILYYDLGKTDEGIDFTTKALAYTPKDIRLINILSVLYKRKGRFKEALQMAQEALSLTDKNNIAYALRLATVAALYADIGLLEKAMALTKQALDIIEKHKGKNAPEYAQYANSMSILNMKLGKYDEALDYALTAQKIEELNKDKPEYYFYQAQVANCYIYLGNLEKALPLALESVEKLAIKPGKKSESYFIAMGTLIRLYQKKGDIAKALALNQEEIDLVKIAWSETDDKYIASLMRLIQLYNANNQADKSAELLKELAQTMNNKVLYNLDVLDAYSKELFINNFIKDYEPLLSSQIKNSTHTDEALVRYAYEAELAIKGIILGSSQLFRQLIENTKNTVVRERNPDAIGKEVLFKKWLSLKETISKAYTRRATQNQIDSLNNELSAIEEKLIAQIPEFQHFNRQTARYQDVKQKLLPDEAAIEFVHFRYHNAQNWTDSILYGALIVRSNQKSPEFIYLCTEQALKSVLMNSKNPQQLYATRGKGRPKKEKPNTLRGNKTAQNDGDTEGVSEATVPAKALYNLIWQPLETYLKDTKTVYYAPSGLLNRVAFAALPMTETDVLSDHYQLHTVSSTRVLLLSDTPTKSFKTDKTSALIYGGIRYEADSTALAKASSFILKKDTNDLLVTTNDLIKATKNANTAWQYLEGTKRETDRIAALFAKKNIKIQVKQGFEASEDDFKAQNTEGGLSPTILHMATHGFFYPISKDMKTENSAFEASDNPLIRSGLVMAGANKIWLEGQPYPGREDGILTAFEIANMNLSGTKLVVLSACETGLGDIQGTEGVYGLQRAFKMAGVDYILMSLWQVPDKQTAELMEKFYTKLLDGLSISSAFAQAQQAMKEKYPPYYWAGFVLIK